MRAMSTAPSSPPSSAILFSLVFGEVLVLVSGLVPRRIPEFTGEAKRQDTEPPAAGRAQEQRADKDAKTVVVTRAGSVDGARDGREVEVPQVQFFDKVETHNMLVNNLGAMPHLVPMLFWWPCVLAVTSLLNGKLGVKGHGMGLIQDELVNNLETIDGFG